jgi:hemoglobin
MQRPCGNRWTCGTYEEGFTSADASVDAMVPACACAAVAVHLDRTRFDDVGCGTLPKMELNGVDPMQGEHVMSQMTSLYERLGGMDAITAVVDSYVASAAGDDRINQKFARTDLPRLKKEFTDQLCEATGGPCTYTGRSMLDIHAGMKVTDGEFDAVIAGLEATFDEFKVPETEQKELFDLLLPMRDEIVEVKSPETGTPLPDSYQPAPPLS